LWKVRLAGFEPATDPKQKTINLESGAAKKSGARDAENALIEPDLSALIEAWPGLSVDVRERVVVFGSAGASPFR